MKLIKLNLFSTRLALSVLILLLLYALMRCHDNCNHREDFTSYYRCDKRPLGGLYKEIFNEEGINLETDLDKFDLYYPCGYNTLEKELKNLDLSEKKDVFGVCGCDTISSKSSLWKTLETYYSRDKAKLLMPESFLLKNNAQIDLFRKSFDPKKIYILKKNIQRKKGIKLSSDLQEIENANKQKFVMVQEKKESIIINKRRMNLRVYVFVECKGGKKSIYIHDSVKCLYTSKDVEENTTPDQEEFETLITNSYVTDLNIYNKNPLTMNKLLDYLHENRGIDKDKLKKKIYKNLTDVFEALVPKLCNCDNLGGSNQYQLFGADILIDTKYEPYILEINKGPDMKHKDEADRVLKKKVIFDTFNKVGVVKGKDNYKNMYHKII